MTTADCESAVVYSEKRPVLFSTYLRKIRRTIPCWNSDGGIDRKTESTGNYLAVKKPEKFPLTVLPSTVLLYRDSSAPL